ncbi:MAG TPA: TonB-dependent receptor [Sphingomicrobium sp.]|nr:TonB-dependent receptor [Sphingomicrobium sp.]
MTDRSLRAAVLGLLATTALASPAWGQTEPQTTGQSPAPGTNATDVTAPPPTTQVAQDGQVRDETEIIITATKREENLQNVPISVQALGTRRLDQLNISNFEQYTKQLPSVSFQSAQPGVTVVYMRGVATGGDGNHSGSLPSVGSYLDEQPVTTIGGTLDVHIYDIARIESLAGPQGTLYGASSEAGTIRIITNKPELGATSGRIDAELNTVNHGGMGGKLEGMINLPVSSNMAFRGVAFYKRDAGYIDNIFGSRTYYVFDDPPVGADEVPNLTVTNAGLEEKNFNDIETYGGRAALKVDLNDNWTATPTFLYQKMDSDGVFFFDPNLGEYKIDRFREDVRKDKFWQAALTIQGKIANFDVTYAGAYMDRKTSSVSDYADYADAYDQLYANYYYGLYGRGLGVFYYLDAAGNRTINPQQYIEGSDHFKKMSQELRFASPSDKAFRVIAGLFYQRQSNLIHQDYKVDGLAPELSVNGLPGTLWLTQQKRVDKDYAAFGEASFDVTPQITVTAGGRWYKFDNSLIGFFGFGRNPGIDPGDGRPFTLRPFNVAASSRTGVAGCFTTSGDTLRDSLTNNTDLTLIEPAVSGSPCVNLGDFVDGEVRPKRAKDTGFIHRLNATWRPRTGLMFYATWSRGFRPGGINRRGDVPPYDADFLSNYEVGWKTTFGRLRWNGAIYHQKWKKFQFSFLGQNSFTEIHNGKDARINGVETDINYVAGGLTLNAAVAYTDAKTKGNVCGDIADTTDDCSLSFNSVPSGTRLPVTPKFKGSATARYSWPVFGDVKAHVQGGIAYKGSARASLRSLQLQAGTFALVDPNSYLGRIRSSTVVDLFAGLDWPRWNVEAFVTNLFDSRDELSRGVNCGSCTRVLIVPGRPRTFGVRTGVKF